MECKAVQNAVSRDWLTGKVKIEYTIESPVSPADIEQSAGKTLRLKTVQWREKRSLDANAYYWRLLSELADKLNLSKPYLHNHLLRFYGQPEIIDGKMIFLVIPDDDDSCRKVDEAETYHVKPTSEVKVGKDGTMYRTYIMLRGSSDYNTAEMSCLIDGLVEECKIQGIETLPPEELNRMLQVYEGNRRKHEVDHTE